MPVGIESIPILKETYARFVRRDASGRIAAKDPGDSGVTGARCSPNFPGAKIRTTC